MTDDDIFIKAIEFPDAADRTRYLDMACDGNEAQKARVASLLRAHEEASRFLTTPAMSELRAQVQEIRDSHLESEQDKASLGAADEATVQTADLRNQQLGASEPEDDDRETVDEEFKKYLSPSTRPNWLGRLAHYEIEAILGHGAFGVVAKAFDEKLHRVVAIKMLRPELATISPPRKRFIREARTAAAVTHENIVGIYAVEEDPVPYLVMEFVPGQTLQARLNQKGPLEIPELLTIALQVARGLAAAHKAKLIHRDIKPANILLTCDPVDRTKISDFGLARAVDDASLTSSGVIAGTPLYMAPEQARGETLDNRADLFSLGSVMYQMVCGRPPFRAATTMAVLKRVCEDTPRPIKDLIPEAPEWLCAIISRLLKKNRDDRFQSADEVVEILERCQRELQTNGVVHFPVLRDPDSIAGPSKNVAKRRKHVSRWLGAAFLSTAVVPIAYMIMMNLGDSSGNTNVPKNLTNSQGLSAQPLEDNPQSGWHGWPANAPPPAIAPFNAERARQHQEAWAKYLNVDVEYTNSIGMKFRLIPPGDFTMGSTAEAIEEALKFTGEDTHWQKCIKSEAPQHKVILTQPIYLGVNEVTQAEYEKVMGVNPSHFAPSGEGKGAVAGMETTSHPVETVSWNHAAEFCAKLSKQEELKPFYFLAGESITPLDGTGYRLPTEAEWENACRAGTTTKYWIGDKDEDLVRAGWFGTNFGGRTHAVGKLQANPFGLYDVHGNVWEWVEDWWEPTYYGELKEKPAINPSGAASAGSLRVLRGGSWHFDASGCRAAFRGASHPPNRHHGIGFRVAIPFAVAQTLTSSSVVPGEPPAKSVSDTQMLDFVRSTGGRLTLGEPPLAGTSLTAIENPRPLSSDVVHFDFCRSKLNEGKEFGDEQLTRLAELLKLRPDIEIGVLNLVGTNITNRGLLTLGQVPIEELMLDNTNVACDEIAEQLSTFPVADWDFGPKLTSKGLEILAKNPYLRGISLDSRFIGLQSLSVLTNSKLERLQLSLWPDRPLPEVPQFKRITSLKSLYLPGPGISKEKVEEFKVALPRVIVRTTRYADRLPRVPQYPENDLEILELVESVGGHIAQYRSEGLVKLLKDDNPRLSPDAININIWNRSEFTDPVMKRLATLMEQRPDVNVVCFHFPGTPITNNGLRSLKGRSIGQIMLSGTNVNGDQLADEASEFAVREWGLVPALTESGLRKLINNPIVSAINILASDLTPSVIACINDSTLYHVGVHDLRASDLPAVQTFGGLSSVCVLALHSSDQIPAAYLQELHSQLPHLEIRCGKDVIEPSPEARRATLVSGRRILRHTSASIADHPPASFLLEFKARRIHGNDAIGIRFPIAGNAAVVSFSGLKDFTDGWSGLALIGGLDMPASRVGVEGDPFADGKEHVIRLIVTPRSVTATLDDKSYVQWEGEAAVLSPYPYYTGEAPLFIGAASDYYVSHLKLEAIDPDEPTKPVERTPADSK